MSFLWTIDEIIKAVKGRLVGSIPQQGVTGLSIDTRTLKPGEAFFALKGHDLDGHDFIDSARIAGAGLCFVEESWGFLSSSMLSVPMVVVPDSMVALERLAIAARARSQAKFIAITGSAGKTSVKDGIAHALAPSGFTHASPASFNNHWGVPITLARTSLDHDYAVLEVGMSAPGEIRALTAMIRPHIAVVTVVGPAHIAHFSDISEIAESKAEIFEALEPGGIALINADDSNSTILAERARRLGVQNIFSFGQTKDSWCQLLDLKMYSDHSVLLVRLDHKKIHVRIGVPGYHMACNALVILSVVFLSGGNIEKAIEALGDFNIQSGRGKRYQLMHSSGPFTLVDESYNANPLSMKAALALFKLAPSSVARRCIAVLGDMQELGEHSSSFHQGLIPFILDSGVDCVFLVGSEMKALIPFMPSGILVEHCETVGELTTMLLQFIKAGDFIMLKASNSMNFNRIVKEILNMFPPEKAGQASFLT